MVVDHSGQFGFQLVADGVAQLLQGYTNGKQIAVFLRVSIEIDEGGAEKPELFSEVEVFKFLMGQGLRLGM
jgi:hypothetical protein